MVRFCDMRIVFVVAVLVFSSSWLHAEPKGTDTYVIANSHSWPPMAYLEGDTPSGLLVDFWNLYSKYNGQTVAFHLVDWSESLEAVKSGAALIHGGLLKSEERRRYLAFSQPIFPLVTGLFLHHGVKNWDHWQHLNIGVVKASFEAEYMASHFPNTRTMEYKNNRDLIEAALEGFIQGFVSDYPTGIYLSRQYGAEDRLMFHKMLYAKPIHVAVTLENEAIMNTIDAGIARIPRAELEELIAQWQPLGESDNSLTELPWMMAKAVGFMILMGVVIVLIRFVGSKR